MSVFTSSHMTVDQGANSSAARVFGVAAVLIAAAALLGWVAHWPWLTSWGPGLATMKPMTAACLMVLGGALAWSKQRPNIAERMGVAVAVVAGLSLMQDMSGIDLGIDRRLLPGWAASEPHMASVRMAPVTAIALMAGGAAQAFGASWPILARASTIALAGAAAVGLLGYLSRVDVLYSLKSFHTPALPTTLALLAIAAGLWARIGRHENPVRPRPLRHHLVLFGLAVTAPLLTFGLYAGQQLGNAQREGQRAFLHREALSLSRSIDREIISEIETLQALAASPSLARGDLAAFHTQATAALEIRRRGAILLIDRDLKQVVNTRVPFGTPLPSARSGAIARQVLATGRPQVSDVFTGQLMGRQSVEVSIPVVIDSRPRYALSRSLEIDAIARVVGEHALPPGWISGTSDRNNLIIARSEQQQEFAGKQLSAQTLAFAGEKSGIAQTVDLQGRPSVQAFHRSDMTGWRTAVWVPIAVLEAPSTALWRSLFLLGVLALGSVALASSLVGGRLTRALTSTRQLIGGLAEKPHAAPLRPTPLSEANELAAALRLAADQRAEAEAQLRDSEATFRAMFAISSVGKTQIDVVTGKFVRVNAAFCDLVGYSEHELVGRSFTEITHPDDIEANMAGIKRHVAGETPVFDVEKRFVRKDGSIVWARVTLNVIRDAEGRPFRTTSVVQDITARKRHEADLAIAAERAAVTQLATRSFNYEFVPETGAVVRTAAFNDLLGYSDTEKPASAEMWRGLIHDADRGTAWATIARGIETKRGYAVDYRVRHKSGHYLWVHDRARVLGARGDMPARVVGMVLDISEQKAREQQVSLLMAEVNHRAKNMLAVVQAIARQTVSKSPTDFVNRFSERIQGLSASQDLLVRSEWKGVSFRDLVHAQLAHFVDLIGTRITLKGPDVRLTPAAAQGIGLALHELATNAGKYGALSTAQGTVGIDWSCEDDVFAMSWIERGGPPVVPPDRRGFGSTVISTMVKATVDGSVDLKFAPGGLEWQLSCPSAKVLDLEPRVEASRSEETAEP